MKRWNGWGDDTISYPLPETAVEKLAAWVGKAKPVKDASLDAVLSSVPQSRLAEAEADFVTLAPIERVRHARGQSLPDWVALRSGQLGVFPDGVAYPVDTSQIRQIIDWAIANEVVLVPYGGGTSVVGHINPPESQRPVLTVDLCRQSRMRSLDSISQLATFGAGVRGPDLEAQLRARGFTLGHFPQSFEYSTLGGWVATRSTGQQSALYGKIERTFAGGRLESPAGELVIPAFPASAAGPDLRELVLGSEGRLGILTEATVRISPLPEEEHFHALFFPNFSAGLEAVREIVQARIPVSMLRLSTATETVTNLALAGHERLIAALEQTLKFLGKGEEKCMLMLGVSGRARLIRFSRRAALAITRKYGAAHIGRYMGEKWQQTRFTTPYLRNTLWERGYAIDTLETAASWEKIPALIEGIEVALTQTLESEEEQVYPFTHVSHVYTDGASIYTSFLFRVQPDPDQTLNLWHQLKSAASQAIVAAGGTISHQHGVGTDHAAYLAAEKGKLGIRALEEACVLFDPTEIMNPNKLVGVNARSEE